MKTTNEMTTEPFSAALYYRVLRLDVPLRQPDVRAMRRYPGTLATQFVAGGPQAGLSLLPALNNSVGFGPPSVA